MSRGLLCSRQSAYALLMGIDGELGVAADATDAGQRLAGSLAGCAPLQAQVILVEVASVAKAIVGTAGHEGIGQPAARIDGRIGVTDDTLPGNLVDVLHVPGLQYDAPRAVEMTGPCPLCDKDGVAIRAGVLRMPTVSASTANQGVEVVGVHRQMAKSAVFIVDTLHRITNVAARAVAFWVGHHVLVHRRMIDGRVLQQGQVGGLGGVTGGAIAPQGMPGGGVNQCPVLVMAGGAAIAAMHPANQVTVGCIMAHPAGLGTGDRGAMIAGIKVGMG